MDIDAELCVTPYVIRDITHNKSTSQHRTYAELEEILATAHVWVGGEPERWYLVHAIKENIKRVHITKHQPGVADDEAS